MKSSAQNILVNKVWILDRFIVFLLKEDISRVELTTAVEKNHVPDLPNDIAYACYWHKLYQVETIHQRWKKSVDYLERDENQKSTTSWEEKTSQRKWNWSTPMYSLMANQNKMRRVSSQLYLLLGPKRELTSTEDHQADNSVSIGWRYEAIGENDIFRDLQHPSVKDVTRDSG